MAEENKVVEEIKKLVSGEATGVGPNVTLLALLELQKSSGKLEAQVQALQESVAGQGKRLLFMQVTIAAAAGGIGVLLYLVNILSRSLATIQALLTNPPS